MSRQQAPGQIEEWKTLLAAGAVTGTKSFTDPVRVAQDQWAKMVEVWIVVTGGGNDDCLVDVYGCPSGVAANRALSTDVSQRTVESAASDPASLVFMVDWKEVGGAFSLGLLRNGATDTLLATVKTRPYRQ